MHFWLVPIVFIVCLFSLYYSYKIRYTRISSLLSDKLLKMMVVNPNTTSKLLQRSVLVSLSGALICFAMARPRWGYEWKELESKKVDIMIALDISPSMLAEDIKPNRLRRAKSEIADLVNMLEGDRVGLTLFSGAAFVLCPLTSDYSAVLMYLDNISTDMLNLPEPQ